MLRNADSCDATEALTRYPPPLSLSFSKMSLAMIIGTWIIFIIYLW